MKNICLNTILSACLFVGASFPAHAENTAQVDFVAPFSFHVGAATLPAGAYRILDSSTTGAVIVMSMQGVPSAVAMIEDSRAAVPGAKSKVTFLQHGGQMYLGSFSRADGRTAELSSAISIR